MKFSSKKAADRIFPSLELARIRAEQHEIIHVSQVVARLECVLDELVELVKIDIGKELARVVADRDTGLVVRGK